MDTPTPMSTSRSPHDADLRRTSRIERPVPLVILGTDRRGESFQEKTYAIAVNLHGCRYHSRHDYAPASWIALQVAGTDGADSPVIRARVCSITAVRTPRELFQVGVELETPGNVWGISVPPLDWRRFLGTRNSGVHSEVTMFPGAPGPASVETSSEVSAAKDATPNEAAHDRITAELLRALQIAADKAVKTSLSTQLDGAASALSKIEDVSKANLRQTEESSARLAESQDLWEKDLVVYRNRAEEIARRIETLTSNSQQALSEIQKFVARFANETAPQLHARITDSFGRAGSEFEARAAQVREQYVAEINDSAQIAAREARSQLDESIAEVRSLLSTANAGVSQERVESLFHFFKEETVGNIEERLGNLSRSLEENLDFASRRTDEIARELQALGSENRQARSQHEQGLADIRSHVANVNAGVPPEHLDSRLNSSREQILSLLEWRLGEVSGHYEQLFGQARNRADELAQQLEKLSTETREHLSQTRGLAERACHEVHSPDLSPIEQAVNRASREFETLVARVSDRHLVRLLEQKQVVSQEAVLELEACSSEARALLQKTANSTFEEFRRRVEVQIDLVLTEAKESFTSSVASMDAESCAAVEARRRLLEADALRAAEQSAVEFRAGIKAFLHSCLAAAVGAVDQQAKTALAGLPNAPGGLPHALDTTDSASPSSENLPGQANMNLA